jgi:hypothetical protein
VTSKFVMSIRTEITLMRTDHSNRKRMHPDLLAIGDDPAERLRFDETIAQINDCVPEFARDATDAKIGSPKLPNPSGVEPLSAAVVV